MECDRELFEAYPSKPRKLLMEWNGARDLVRYHGEAFVSSGRVKGSPEDAALHDAELHEQALHRALFGI